MFELLTALALALVFSTATPSTSSNSAQPPASTQQASSPGDGGEIIIKGG